MKTLLSLFVPMTFLLLTHCQTTPDVVDDGSDLGIWEGKAQMVDTARGKKIWGYVQWYSDSPQGRLRVDVNAVFGISIATFIMDNSGARLWLHQENKYIVSNDPQKLFAELIKFELDPNVFFALLKSQPRLNAPWQCKEKPPLMRCTLETQAQGQKVQMLLKNKAENMRDIKIAYGKKSLRLVLKRTKVQVPDKVFSQKKSFGYKKIEI